MVPFVNDGVGRPREVQSSFRTPEHFGAARLAQGFLVAPATKCALQEITVLQGNW